MTPSKMLTATLMSTMVVLIFSSSAGTAQPLDVEFDDIFADTNLTDLVDPKDLESAESKFTVTLLNDNIEGNVTTSSPVFDLLRPSNFSLQGNFSDNGLALAARKKPSRCGKGNPMDDCWQCDPYWHKHRQNLAFCAIGFGRNAIGGLNGETYIVTDPGNDNPTDPRPGTLRWAVVQERPMWIIFARDMTIRLKQELIMTSYKTIDGRGVNVHIAYGACITLQRVHHVIIHGVHIHDCKATGPARVRSSMSHVGKRGRTDGDGISIISSSNIWIDHNSFSRCTDGLVDAIHGSDLITISNNYFSNHDKVMLLGASDSDGGEDKIMQVTVAMNYFGPKLCQRMPRCRFGTFHVFNNFYSGWTQYAIGGSSSPTVNSEGNYFRASRVKQAIKHLGNGRGNWRTSGDKFVNGAYFSPAGAEGTSTLYNAAKSFHSRPAYLVPRLTAGAGPTGRSV